MQVYNTLKEQVIDGGLCTHCGLCAGLSEGQLTMQETAAGPLPRPAAGIHPQTIDLPNEALTACPGYQVDYPGTLSACVRSHAGEPVSRKLQRSLY